MVKIITDRDQSGSVLCISSSILFNIPMFLYCLQLEYDTGQTYTGSRHVFILEYTWRKEKKTLSKGQEYGVVLC